MSNSNFFKILEDINSKAEVPKDLDHHNLSYEQNTIIHEKLEEKPYRRNIYEQNWERFFKVEDSKVEEFKKNMENIKQKYNLDYEIAIEGGIRQGNFKYFFQSIHEPVSRGNVYNFMHYRDSEFHDIINKLKEENGENFEEIRMEDFYYVNERRSGFSQEDLGSNNLMANKLAYFPNPLAQKKHYSNHEAFKYLMQIEKKKSFSRRQKSLRERKFFAEIFCYVIIIASLLLIIWKANPDNDKKQILDHTSMIDIVYKKPLTNCSSNKACNIGETCKEMNVCLPYNENWKVITNKTEGAWSEKIMEWDPNLYFLNSISCFYSNNHRFNDDVPGVNGLQLTLNHRNNDTLFAKSYELKLINEVPKSKLFKTDVCKDNSLEIKGINICSLWDDYYKDDVGIFGLKVRCNDRWMEENIVTDLSPGRKIHNNSVWTQSEAPLESSICGIMIKGVEFSENSYDDNVLITDIAIKYCKRGAITAVPTISKISNSGKKKKKNDEGSF